MMQCDCQNKMAREEMLQFIREINFTIIELGLYLNTHPDDEKAVCMHREYCKKYREKETRKGGFLYAVLVEL